jgi:hypothetical protein
MKNIKNKNMNKRKFYRLEIRPTKDFETFRTQDVGKKGGLERLAGKKADGTWQTVAWLIEKSMAHKTKDDKLIIDDSKAKSVLRQVGGPIKYFKDDVFKAKVKVPVKAQKRINK